MLAIPDRQVKAMFPFIIRGPASRERISSTNAGRNVIDIVKTTVPSKVIINTSKAIIFYPQTLLFLT